MKLDKLDYSQSLLISEKLIELAEKENNDEYRAYAFLDRGTSRLFTNDWKLAWDDLEKAYGYASVIKNDSLKALALNCQGIFAAHRQGNLYLGQQLFLKSLDYAKEVGMTRLLPSIYNNIAQTARLQNDSTGIKYAFEQHKLAIKSKNKHDEYLSLINMGWFHYLMGDYDAALRCIREGFDIQRSNGFSNHGDLDRLKVEILMNQGNLIEAENTLDSSIDILKKENSTLSPEILILKADLLHRKKDYKGSLEILQQLSESPDAKPFLTKIYSLMEKDYIALGDLAKANDCLHAYIDNLSVLHASERDLLVNERKMLLDIVEKENRIERDAILIRNRERLIISMIIIIVLAALTIAGGFYYHRRQQKLFRKIVAQYSEALQREESLEGMLNMYRSKTEEIAQDNSSSPKESPIASSTSDEIYEKLCRCVEEEKLYADPKFTREELIEKIGTNRTYLSKIIKEKTGGNYSQFMNHFRVREAIKLLSDLNNGDKVLKDVYLEIGFISKSSFYKVFKETVGMTPAQFREQYRKMVQENDTNPDTGNA